MSETPHILVVEDEEILLQFLVYHVENAGYRATAITTGGEIFPYLDNGDVDLILLDLGLPDGDGLSRAQQIRERSSVPIVVLTARKGADDRVMALGLGADDYLTKPCDPRELLLRIRNVLARCGAAAQPGIAAPAPTAPPPVPAPAPAPATPVASAPSAPQPEKRSSGIALFLIAALIIVAGGGGGWWYMTQPVPEPIEQQASKSALIPPSVSQEPKAETSQPQPAPSKKASSFDVTVTAKPATDPENGESTDIGTAPSATKQTEPSPAASSYSWVLKSKCPPLPELKWWRFNKHTDLVRYVNKRHGGDWQPYIQSWVDRLAKLQNIYSRNSGIKTKTGEILKGPSLKQYIDDTQARLDITICLSREATDFAYKKSLLKR
ncbi:MAG: response regulator [Rhodospirillaceae bacterium]|jgi:CheY-like chemotaxis protein|nr:response regulator [Rhodospirillaceae bacterium]